MIYEGIVLPAVMALSELLGAAAFAKSDQNRTARLLLTCFGLGFALSILLADIVPDVLRGNSLMGIPLAAGVLLGGLLVLQAGARRQAVGGALALAGMGLHNLCEGIVLATVGPVLSPILLVGAVAHKLPEGVVVFSLADRLSSRWRWIVASGMSLLIPLGAWISFPERFVQPLLAVAAGILGAVLLKSLAHAMQKASSENPSLVRGTPVAATLLGAALAGLSCLVI